MTLKQTREPQQPRARRTREKLLSALEMLLKEKDFDQIAVTDIARTAGVAVGSVYSHFADKDAFLASLIEARADTIERRVSGEEAVPGVERDEDYPDLLTGLRAAVRGMLAQIDADAHIIRAIFAHERRARETDPARQTALVDAAIKRTREFLAPFEDDIAGPSLDDAARLVNWYLNALGFHRAFGDNRSGTDVFGVTDDDIIRTLPVMLHGLLTRSGEERLVSVAPVKD